MVRIVHIAMPIGGVGVYLNLLAQHLNKDNFEQIILYNKEDVEFQENLFKKASYIPIIREINLFKDFKCLLKIIRLLRVLKPNIIHCHSAKAGIFGRIAGAYLKISAFYTPHAYSYLSTKSKFKRTLFKSIEKAFRFFPSNTIACSPSEYDRTINDLLFNKNKVFLWNNSIEDNLEGKLTEFTKRLPENFICSIGRPSYQKHTELLVKTITEVKKSIKDIHLVILGVGFYSPSFKNAEKLIKENNLSNNITLVHWLERAETMAILQKSLLYVSTSRYEGLPYSVIEALALAKPCIVTNVDGNKDLIKNGYNGFLVKENPLRLAEKIIELLNNLELYDKMSSNSRKLFEESYDIRKNIVELENIYKSIK